MKKAVCMPCTEAQFEAMRPKLETIEGLEIVDLDDWNEFPFIVNNIYDTSNLVSNLRRKSCTNGRTAYPEFDEQIFLDACGYDSSKENKSEFEQLKERVHLLEKEISHLRKIAEGTQSLTNDEINLSKIKTGSLVKLKYEGDIVFDVVLWESRYFIKNMRFAKADVGIRCFTFHHEGEYINRFLCDGEKIDLIAEVIEY